MLKKLGAGLLVAPMLVTTFLGLTVPTLLYRWSLKGTSLIWFPLVWAVREEAERTPERMCASEFMKFARRISGFVLLLLAGKVVYLFMGADIGSFHSLMTLLQRVRRPEVLRAFIVPDSFPTWQILLGVSAGLSFVSFWYADRLKNRGQGQVQQPLLNLIHTVQGALGVAVTFRLITIAIAL